MKLDARWAIWPIVDLGLAADDRKRAAAVPDFDLHQWFADEELDEIVYRLGNMTLLETSANRGLGNAAFFEKKAVYMSSQFQITKNVALENSDWNISRISARQAWMANQARPSASMRC